MVTELRFKGRRIAIVGNRGGTNIGGSFERAAKLAKLDVQFLELKNAMVAPALLRRFNWYCRGRRPTWLNRFSKHVVESCLRGRSEVVVVTGIAAVNFEALCKLKQAGIKVANYLTDDPWNPMHRAPWFLKALPEYFAVFTPRRANIADLRKIGCKIVSYLPFGYDPELHFPEKPSDRERDRLTSDVLFVGGADPDRLPLCGAIGASDLSLAIYGDYWGRSKSTRPFWKGYADPTTLRKVTGSAKVCLTLTRKANRDGHTMRSFEVAAMRGVILAEGSEEHYEIFGGNGALYFDGIPEMISKAKWLATHESQARLMANQAYTRVTGGANTYGDRLEAILNVCLS